MKKRLQQLLMATKPTCDDMATSPLWEDMTTTTIDEYVATATTCDDITTTPTCEDVTSTITYEDIAMRTTYEDMVDLDFKNLRTEQKARLNEMVCEIIDKTVMDYENQEIKYIVESVNTMLQSAVDRVNERISFRIARIEPCRGMSNKRQSGNLILK